MATIAQALPAPSDRSWIRAWLRDELAPYPGRVAVVARMVTAATLVMIISMTFRLPFAAYGAIYALTLSRESLGETKSAVWSLALGFSGAGAYAILGAMVVLGDPMLRLVWVIGTFFLMFYAMAATSNWAVAARFGYLFIITTPLWDRSITANAKVENTLWAVGTITLASVIALVLEIVYAALGHRNDLMDAINERLSCVEEVLHSYADNRPLESSTEKAITRLAMVGSSRLRRILDRSNLGPYCLQEMGAVVGLVGRLVDLTANLSHFATSASGADRRRIAKLTAQITEIRGNLAKGLAPSMEHSDFETDDWPSFPLLGEIERTVLLIPQSFSSSQTLKVFAPVESEVDNRHSWFPLRALSNPENLKFGLRGCLAASVCYLIYNALDWPEISTAVTTCFLTALTTIGSSRQKQVLRFGGAFIGGAIGLFAQVFVLPSIDSIAGFTVFFLLVTAFAAWITTSSARLSYLGQQVFVAFALVNLQEFKFQTSLTVGRDRVIGILLGLFVMWICFDQLWSAPAGVEMRRTFVSSLRLLAQLAREPLSRDLRTAIDTSYILREKINASFEKARSLADGVLFEFGPSRDEDLKFRDLVRRWQPQFRALFVMRIASLKYRLRAPGFETPESISGLQAAYDAQSADLLERMAEGMEHAGKEPLSAFERPPDSLKRSLDEIEAEARRTLPPGRAESYITLLGGIDRLTASLATEVAAV